VKIAHWKQFRSALLKPFFFSHSLTFRAVAVTTGIVSGPLEVTGITVLHMTTESSRPALVNSLHDSQLMAW
jgi:hypothetical protein